MWYGVPTEEELCMYVIVGKWLFGKGWFGWSVKGEFYGWCPIEEATFFVTSDEAFQTLRNARLDMNNGQVDEHIYVARDRGGMTGLVYHDDRPVIIDFLTDEYTPQQILLSVGP